MQRKSPCRSGRSHRGVAAAKTWAPCRLLVGCRAPTRATGGRRVAWASEEQREADEEAVGVQMAVRTVRGRRQLALAERRGLAGNEIEGILSAVHDLQGLGSCEDGTDESVRAVILALIVAATIAGPLAATAQRARGRRSGARADRAALRQLDAETCGESEQERPRVRRGRDLLGNEDVNAGERGGKRGTEAWRDLVSVRVEMVGERAKALGDVADVQASCSRQAAPNIVDALRPRIS